MPATEKQIEYIEILCNDVGFDTRTRRLDFISNLLGYKVTFLDDLALPEASQVINKLKEMKDVIRNKESDKYHKEWDND